MASNSENISELRLSSLKFSNWQTTDSSDNKGPSSGPQPANVANTAPTSQTLNPPLYDFRRPEAFERMDTDKPGEELAHDAAIWKLYLEEADDYDQELVKSRHASLDMLLLFAALFSAILTAFLIESKNLLQQDHGEMSASLLLVIAQSQQRIELGLPAPVASDPIDLPVFSPPMSARWINGIWFSALGLSLSAALIAMLAKEWLTAYLSSRPRPAHAHAMLRQSRIEGLERWWALHIILLLPSVLHLSLLLFSIGLVIYLWTLDVAIAAVIAGLIGLTMLFYGTTAVLGAIYEFCPFVTQISSYITAICEMYRGTHNSNRDTSSPYTSASDLKALMWLANNARDPAVVDCSYQALAGLRLHTGNPLSPMTRLSEDQGNKANPSELEGMLLQSNGGTSLNSLFAVVCGRFTRLTRNHEELSTSGWANVARYTKALTGLASQIQRQGTHAPINTEGPSGNLPGETNSQIITLAREALRALDNLWTESAPPLHAEVYASFVTSELLLLSLALPNDHRRPLSSHVVDFVPKISVLVQDSYLSLFRSQYSRSLVRASSLIWTHSNRRATIGAVPLSKLLIAIHAASNCVSLNPADGYSTHHSSSSPAANNFKTIVPYLYGIHTYEPWGINSGILGSILSLIGSVQNESDDSALLIRTAAIQAVASLAPVVIQQVCGLDRREVLSGLDYTTWLEGIPLDMNKIRYIATRQALHILRILGARMEIHHHMCRATLVLIRNLFNENDRQMEATALAILHRGVDIIPLLEHVTTNNSAFLLLNNMDIFNIINIVTYPFRHDINFTWNLCTTVLPPTYLPTLIRMVETPSTDKGWAERVLGSVVERMRNREGEPPANIPATHVDIPCIAYLHRFTHVADGFFALGQAELKQTSTEAVISAITQITHIAVGRDSGLVVDPIELRPPAVPSFLDNVVLVAKHCTENSERYTMLLQFSTDALDLLDVALKDDQSRRHIQQHGAYGMLSISLAIIKDNEAARELMERVGRIVKELGMTIPQSEPDGTSAQADDPSNMNDNIQEGEAGAPGHPDMQDGHSKVAIRGTRSEEGEHISEP